MNPYPAWTLAPLLLGHLVAGLALGAAYFLTLRWSSDRLANGRAMPATIALIIGRFTLLAAALALTSLEGAMPLLLTALGVFIARSIVLRRTRLNPV